jgi:cell wall-associated NlpC family hydrolase
MTAPKLTFLDTGKERALLLDAICGEALRMRGLPYGSVTTAHREGVGGRWQGEVNCFGVLLLAAREAGLLPADFDVNLSPERFGQSVAKSVMQILYLNFEHAPKTDLQPGDVMLFRWKDCDHRRTEPHHVALFISPAIPYGAMVHALDTTPGGGGVFWQRMSELEWQRLEQVWRLK